MKNIRILLILTLALLLVFQGTAVALADSNPDTDQMAVYLKGKFYQNNANLIGDVYTAEGDIEFGTSGSTVFNGTGYHNVAKSLIGNVPSGGTIEALATTSFDKQVLDVSDAPVIANYVADHSPQWNTDPYIITEDTHFGTLKIDSSNGTSPVIVDTSQGDIRVVVDNITWGWGKTLKVIGDNRLLLYIKGTGSNIQIVNENHPNDSSKLYIITTGNLSSQSSEIHGNVIFKDISEVTYYNKTWGSVVADAGVEKLTAVGGDREIHGILYAPDADIIFNGGAKLYGKLVGKSLNLDGGTTIIEYDASASLNIPAEILEGGSGDPDPEGPGPEDPEPNLPDPDGYENGILGTYYDSYEPVDQAKKLRRIDSNIAFNLGYTGYPHETMDREDFSIVWEGFFRAPATGTYVFKTLSDDGVRLYVNNTKIIDHWGLYSYDYLEADAINLTAGELYPIKLDYQQGPLYAAAFLFYAVDGTDMGLVPNDHLFVGDSTHATYATPVLYNTDVAKSGTGFSNKFYSITTKNEDPTGGAPDHTEVNNINYNWGWGAPGTISTDMFFGTMEGLLEAKFTEAVTLSFTVDDALRVWVENDLVIDSWKYNNRSVYEHTFNVQAGDKYHIKIEYADFMLSGSIHMSWKSASIKTEIVPREYMYLAQ